MDIGFGWYALGLLLVLVAVRMYFKKPSFVPQESCWRCLWRNLDERTQQWFPGRNLRFVLAVFVLGAIFGSIAMIEYRAWTTSLPGPIEATSTRG